MKPAKHQFTLLQQVMSNIPAYLVSSIARKFGIDKQSRTITAWNHLVALVYAQLSHALGLNDVCDTLRIHSGALSTVRNAAAPSRNGLSSANRTRDAGMARVLFYEMLSKFTTTYPKFGRIGATFKLPRGMKRIVNLLDSTTVPLVANSMDWAKHRRRKAAAKCHTILDAQTFLPRFAVVKSAGSSDAVVGRSLCAALREGEIVVFDKAYVDYSHLYELAQRGVVWVTRPKTNMKYRVVKKLKITNESIVLDAQIKLAVPSSKSAYPESMRLIVADVVRDGQVVRMEFITDNFKLAASTIADLYKSRWDIELFFKQIKQTLKLSDFLGYNENAVQWQIWTALLCYLILRFIAFVSKWKGAFIRLFAIIRGSLWSRLDLYSLLNFCGIADKRFRLVALPQPLYLPLFGH